MKKFKKLTALALALALALSLCLTGCSSGGDAGGSTASADSTGTDGGDPLKVVLLITSNLGDQGFYDSANDGLKLIEQELALKCRPSKWDRTLPSTSRISAMWPEQDWDYIIIGSSPAVDAANMLIPEYPEKKFIMFDTEVDWSSGDFSNLYCVQYKQNEASFRRVLQRLCSPPKASAPTLKKSLAVWVAATTRSSTIL